MIKNHPYLEQAVTAVTVRSIEPLSVDSDNTIEAISATDKIMVGTMSDEFIKWEALQWNRDICLRWTMKWLLTRIH